MQDHSTSLLVVFTEWSQNTTLNILGFKFLFLHISNLDIPQGLKFNVYNQQISLTLYSLSSLSCLHLSLHSSHPGIQLRDYLYNSLSVLPIYIHMYMYVYISDQINIYVYMCIYVYIYVYIYSIQREILYIYRFYNIYREIYSIIQSYGSFRLSKISYILECLWEVVHDVLSDCNSHFTLITKTIYVGSGSPLGNLPSPFPWMLLSTTQGAIVYKTMSQL